MRYRSSLALMASASQKMNILTTRIPKHNAKLEAQHIKCLTIPADELETQSLTPEQCGHF